MSKAIRTVNIVALLIISIIVGQIYLESACAQCCPDSVNNCNPNMGECQQMQPDLSKSSRRNIFQRLFGKCATQPPQDASCWKFENGQVIIDLAKASELAQSGRGIRLESEEPPVNLLVIRGDDGSYYAFENKCAHGGRKLDPVPGGGTVQCCSVGKSTYDYNGKVLKGAAQEDIVSYPVRSEDGSLYITLSKSND